MARRRYMVIINEKGQTCANRAEVRMEIGGAPQGANVRVVDAVTGDIIEGSKEEWECFTKW